MSADRCDYCGAPGCHWRRHAQARADVAAWEREQARLANDHPSDPLTDY